MENDIELRIMTRELCHKLFMEWENDEMIYEDMSRFSKYIYNEEKVNAYFDARQESSRIMFAIMLGDEVIGGLDLKHIDYTKKECTLSIHMKNDSYKGKGYGCAAEKMAVQYAFDVLGLDKVNADTILKNTRSAHVLEKAGFVFREERDGFRFYSIEKAGYKC